MFNVLFVCSQNMCRSPYCDYVFKKMVAEDPFLCDKVSVQSSAVMTPGTSLDPLTAAAMRKEGIDEETIQNHKPGYIYRKKDWKLFKEADIIICMTRSHYLWTPLFFWKKTVPLAKAATGKYKAVPDPWLQRDPDKYQARMDIIKAYLEQYLEVLRQQLS